MSNNPIPSPAIRISACALSDTELAYLADLFSGTDIPIPHGWSAQMAGNIEQAFVDAAKFRDIKDGVRVVTQTVDLRS
jgi:hypothetical protein